MRKIYNIIFITVLVVGIISSAIGIGKFIEIKRENAELKRSISLYEEYIDDLEVDSASKDRYIGVLEQKNDSLAKSAETYKAKVLEYEKEKKEQSRSSETTLKADSGFRSWMPYTAIASGTPQYEVVHKASPNEYGILEYEGCAVVAVGFGWNLDIGDKAIVTTDKGSYKIVVGDWKAKCDTDSTNKVTLSNGCVVEFIVDRNSLAQCIKSSGSVASVDKYAGKVKSISHWEDTNGNHVNILK